VLCLFGPTSADPVDPVMNEEDTRRVRFRGLKCVESLLVTGLVPLGIRFQRNSDCYLAQIELGLNHSIGC
jgi:hypothetical protein